MHKKVLKTLGKIFKNGKTALKHGLKSSPKFAKHM
jgi:hypothetical protein